MRQQDYPAASTPGTTAGFPDLFLPTARSHGRSLRSSTNRTLYKGRGVSCRTPEFFSQFVRSNVRAANQSLTIVYVKILRRSDDRLFAIGCVALLHRF